MKKPVKKEFQLTDGQANALVIIGIGLMIIINHRRGRKRLRR